MNNLRFIIKKKLASMARSIREMSNTQLLLQNEYVRLHEEILSKMPNNPAGYGYKSYSQCDEDGIIANIFSKIGEKSRIFMEIGCGDGLENNTHLLAIKGWEGSWIDANHQKIEHIKRAVPNNKKLKVVEALVTEENVCGLAADALHDHRDKLIDFFSIDIDSNDLDVLLKLLDYTSPRVICVEYNPKFYPPFKISVKSKTSGWSGDDYHGASLSAFADCLKFRGYALVACSLSGVNAFFVHNDEAHHFGAYSVEAIYQPARYYLRRLESGHHPSLKFLADSLRLRD